MCYAYGPPFFSFILFCQFCWPNKDIEGDFMIFIFYLSIPSRRLFVLLLSIVCRPLLTFRKFSLKNHWRDLLWTWHSLSFMSLILCYILSSPDHQVASVVRRNLFTFSSSSLKPVDGFKRNFIGMFSWRFFTNLLIFVLVQWKTGSL